MKVRRYFGESMADILTRIKSEMGGDAIIVQTRQRRRGGLFGFFRPPLLEVIAAIEHDSPSEQPVPSRNRLLRSPEPDLPARQMLSEQFDQLKAMLLERLPGPSQRQVYPENFERVYQLLICNEVNESLARRIVDTAMHEVDQSLWKDQEAVFGKVQEIVAGYFLSAEQPQNDAKLRLALVGPTGVGKTTTIAKIAAIASIMQGKSVALITIDTFRMAAIDQLRAYSEIISVPMEVAHTPRELCDLVAKHDDKEIILVDTMGRSPYNKVQLTQVRGFLEGCPGLKTCLVLSVSANPRDIWEIMESFERFQIDKLVFTKLDETRKYGVILNVVEGFKKELAFITDGQNVPDDIEVPVPAKLAKLILRERDCLA